MGLVCRNWEVRNLMSWKFVRRKKKKKKKKTEMGSLSKTQLETQPDSRKTDPITDSIFQVGLGFR